MGIFDFFRKRGERRAVVEELEPRILYSADLNPAAAPDTTQAATEQVQVGSVETTGVTVQHAAPAIVQVRESQARELLFVDAALADADERVQELVQTRGSGVEIDVIQIRSDANGLTQITEALAAARDISAVHILSEGGSGALHLGGGGVDLDGLRSRAGEIPAWGASLTEDADILIWGADAGDGANRQAFMQELAAMTGAHVAAGADVGGTASSGASLTGWTAALDATQAETTQDSVAAVRQEIVFVSPSVRDYQELLDGISPNVEVHVLDPTGDGVLQVAEALAGRTNVDAVHLIAEGSGAQLHLGSSFLTQDSISTTYAEQFRRIGQSLSQNADILVYGCNFGQGEAGLTAIQTLADLTGADVAASTDRTGSVAEFGNWQLEVSAGAIETAVVISVDTQATWDHALATFTVTNTNNSGGGSLRQAILDANANAGTDTIVFNIALNDSNHLYYRDNGGAGFSAPVTTTLADASITDFDADYVAGTARSWYRISLTGASLDVTQAVIIDGSTQSGYDSAKGPIIEIDASGVSSPIGDLNAIALTTGASTIRGLVINGAGDNAIEIDTNAGSSVIVGNYFGTDVSGTIADGNATVGTGGPWGAIAVKSNNVVIGGATAADRNVISGNNGYGIEIYNSASGTTIRGNYIGTTVTGTGALGNASAGIYLRNSATGAIIGGVNNGEANIIANNGGDGIWVTSGTNTSILRNTIHSNTELGIDLGTNGVTVNDLEDGDAGTNNLLNFPVITNVVQNGANLDVTFSVDLPTGWYRIEFYENVAGADPSGFGEGRTFLGAATINVASNPAGYTSFTSALANVTPSAIVGISATATQDTSGGAGTTFGSTSEFGPSFLGAGVLVVDTTSDAADAAGFGTATFNIASLLGNRGADGKISLREAIDAANRTTNIGGTPDQIRFNIPDALVGGAHTITLTYDGADAGTVPDALPLITNPVVIDGTTEPDFATQGRPVIELNGNNVGTLVQGLYLGAGSNGSTISGLIINRFTGSGIEISGSNNHTIQGNWIGLDATGMAAAANGVNGIAATNSTGNLIGGTTAAARNVIAGNAHQGILFSNVDNSSLSGNYIGTDVAGTGDVNGTTSNTLQSGIYLTNGSSGNTIGGTTSDAGNVISGNNHYGLEILGATSQNNLVQGNYIGTDQAGQVALGNKNGGVSFWGAGTGNVLGGTTVAARNVISGNTGNGVLVGNASTGATVQGNYIGVAADGVTTLANTGPGVLIEGGSTASTVGGSAGNLIANNGAAGIVVNGAASTGNALLGNSITGNAGLGIDLDWNGVTVNDPGDGDAGANNLQNFPAIYAVTIAGSQVTITGEARAGATVEFFESDSAAGAYGEGQSFLGRGTVPMTGVRGTTDASALQFSFTFAAGSLVVGDTVTATATDPSNNTSEFSLNVTASAAVNTAPSFFVGDGNTITSTGANWDAIRAVAIQTDGKTIAAGSVNNGGSDIDFFLARYHTDGTLDVTFGTGGIIVTAITANADSAESVAIQADGKILVAGSRNNGLTNNFAVVRYNPDGTLDTTFGGTGIVTFAFSTSHENAQAIRVQADGKIIVAGYADIGGNDDFAIARLNSDGTLDTTFSGDGKATTSIGAGEDRIYDIAIQTDGAIVAVGSTHNGTDTDIAIVRYTSTGALDAAFDGDGTRVVAIGTGFDLGYAVALQSDGKIVIAGDDSTGVNSAFTVVRLNTDGSLDTTFSGDGIASTMIGSLYDHAFAVAIQPDGKIVVAGESFNGTDNDVALLRYHADGTLDNSFSGDGRLTTALGSATDSAAAVALQPDGRIVVGGYGTFANGDAAILRYNVDGSLDTRYSMANTLDGTPTFTEGGAAVVLDSNVQIFDAELSVANDFSGSTLTLARNGGANPQDQLAFDGVIVTTSGANVLVSGVQVGTYTFTGGQMVVTFGANATQARVDTLMRNVVYSNSSDAPPASVQINWTFSDGNLGAQGSGGALQASGSVTVNITATNDAPALSGTNNLAAINRNPVSNPGTLVADLIGGQVSDPDAGAAQGIAVTAVVNTNGAWEYSTNGGANWTAFGTPSAGAARLLAADASTYVRFVPNANWSGTVSNGLTFRAWDQTSGSAGATADTSTNGGATAFSAAAASASIVVTASNTAPTLSGANNLSAISEDAAANAGTLVSTLIAGRIADVDPGAVSGIAVSAVDNSNGTWQYTLNGGGLWTDFGTPSTTAARLLAADANTSVRFVPNANWNGAVNNGITFSAWDRTSGVAGGTANVVASVNVLDQFGVAAYSNNSGSASWSGNWVETDSGGGGATGGNILVTGGALRVGPGTSGNGIYREANLAGFGGATLSFNYTNALSSGNPMIRVRVSGDGGATYTTLASFSQTLNTGSGSLSFDITGYSSNNTRVQFDVSSSAGGPIYVAFDDVQIVATGAGGSSAFSTASASSSVTVNAVNDAPTRTAGTAANLTVAEDAGATSLGLGALAYAPGGGSDESAQTLTYTVTAVPSVALGNITLADGTTVVTASTSYSLAQLRGMMFRATPDANGGPLTFSWSVGDSGGTANGGVNTLSESLTVSVTAVNDAPVVATSGSTLAYTENQSASAVDAGITVADIDSANLMGATVSISANFVSGQDVLAFTDQNGITGSWSAATGVLTLSGSATAADYQAALRSITYANTSEAPSTLTRTVSFVLNDGSANSNTGTRNIGVAAVNDAPTLGNGTLGAVNEDTASPAGATVATIFAGQFADADAGASFGGIAVIGNTADAGTQGTWQYSSNGGTNWFAFGTVADGATALAVGSSSLIRFVPVANYSGTPPALTVRGLDNSYAGAFSTTAGSETRVTVNTTTNGGTTAIAAATATLSTSITATNDAPVNTVPGAQNTNEDTNLVFSSGNGNQISISDVDASGNVEVTLSVTNGTLTIPDTTGLSFTVGDGSADSTMTFSGTVATINTRLDGLIYTPTANYNGSGSLQITTVDVPGLAGYYTFSATDPGNDSSPLGTGDGTVVGATIVNDGVRGDVLNLDGNDYVQIAGNFGSPANITLAAWVNLTARDTNGADVISLGDNVAIRLDYFDGGVIGVSGFAYNGTTWPVADSGQMIAGTGWHHVAYTVDTVNDAHTLYIDGVAVVTEAFTGSINFGLGADTFIGRHGNNDNSTDFNGKIDDAAIFRRALSAQEIARLAASSPGFDTDSVAITVGAVNDQPAFAGLDGTPGFTEGGSAVALDSNVTIADVELTATNFYGATVTLARNGGANPQDMFAATGTLSALTQGGALVVNGTTIGTVTTNSGGTLVLTFDSNATQARVNDVVRQIAYVNVSDTPPASVQINWTLDDGNGGAQGSGGALQATGSTTVSITALNDPPVVTSNGAGATASISVAENTTAVTTVTSTDPDGLSPAYSIVPVASGGAADADRFTIDPVTGVLRFFTAPDFEAPADADFDNIYEVTVRVGDGASGIDTQTISVTVTNINDAPVITSNSGGATASVNVAENIAAVTTVTATDADVPANALTYSIVGGADQALFMIDPTTGALMFNTAPNFEVPGDVGGNNVYDVTVQVADGNGGTDTQAIAITVTDANDAPIITSDGGGATANINVAEGATGATSVTTVTGTDADADVPANTLTYSIVGGADQALFSINPTTGALAFNTAPNFAAPADAGGNNVYDVTVQVADGNGGTDTQAIAITVTDANDAPIITSNGGGATANVNVAENTAGITTVTATDADVPANTLTYSIVGGADQALFTINPTTGALTFNTAPNFEAPGDVGGNNVYDVTVQVTDGNGGTDTQAMAITVTNANDAPIIGSNGGGATAGVNVAENTTGVTTVTTTDADVPANTLTYSIVGGADQALFAINPTTGALTFSTAPNFEAPADAGGNNVYDVTVQVADGNGGTDTQAIAITVADANDAPIITSNGSGATATVNAVENQTTVTTITATDADVPANTLTYSISGGADAAQFSINSTTGAFTFNTAPNFEAPADAGGNNVYDVTVQVSDGNGGTDTQAIAITVTDANDAPVITSNGGGATASVNVAENTTGVTTVTATDVDVPANTLTYSIVGGADQALFTINPTTGVLTFNTAPNFEAPADAGGNNVYDVTVQVADGNGGTDTQAIAVTATNVNEAPVATLAGPSVTFVEDGPAQVIDALIGVSDVDSADFNGGVLTVTVSQNGTVDDRLTVGNFGTNPGEVGTSGIDVTYGGVVVGSFGGGTTGSDPLIVAFNANATVPAVQAVLGSIQFSISSHTPSLLDRQITFGLTDGDGGTAVPQVAVVRVQATNDAPIISSNGGGASAATSVAENSTAVTTVASADVDGGTPSYSIVGGADQALFTINPTTGALMFTTAPNFEAPTDAGGNNVYDVTVHVADGNGGSDTQAIAITVTDANDAPVITSNGGGATANINVAEGATNVTTVTATDADAPANTLTYSIVGGADASLFSINPTTGALTFNSAPNFEAPADAGGDNVYDVSVQVSDGNGGTDTQAIAITVTSVNEAPTGAAITGGVVAENAAAGTVVGSLTGIDPDVLETLTYGLVDNAGGRFTIDSASGQIIVANGTLLDFESATSHNVVVRVTDAAGLSVDQLISIAVSDVNDVAGAPAPDGTINPLPSAPQQDNGDPNAASPGNTATNSKTPVEAGAVARNGGGDADAIEGRLAAARGDSDVAESRQIVAPLRTAVLEARETPVQPIREGFELVANVFRRHTVLYEIATSSPALNAMETDEVVLQALGWKDGKLTLVNSFGIARGTTVSVGAIVQLGDAAEEVVELARRNFLEDPVRLVGAAFAAGFVWWASHSGGLAAAIAMGLPAWRHVDVLPVLGKDDEDDEDDGTLADSNDAHEASPATVFSQDSVAQIMQSHASQDQRTGSLP